MKNIFTFDASTPLLFTHYYFWVFFTVVFAGLVLLKSKVAWRNAFLCFASLFFYFKTSGLFVLILFFTTIFNFYQAKLIHHTSGVLRKISLCMGLMVNLFFLCYFKYAYFVTDMLNQIFGMDLRIFNSFAWVGNVLAGTQRFDVSLILLPVGISFFTFQNISYIVDVFRKRVGPVSKIWDFGFYVTFFPGLVAGPIVRANEFVPQIYKPFFLGRKQFGIAVFWILNGLIKKIILSDYIAVNFVDRVFENPMMFTGFENLAALFAYSLQVYADFSGYTDIAIGVAMMMGFYLPKNFNSPYKATSPSDFWRRWHLSLSTWLKDYLYISMGGNRNATFASYSIIIVIGIIAVILSGSIWVGAVICVAAASTAYLAYAFPHTKQKINTNVNLMNTMLIGGLWHGASWNFVIWGGLNGIGIVFYKFWKAWTRQLQLHILLIFTAFFVVLGMIFSIPVVNIAAVWVSVIFVGTLIRTGYGYLAEKISILRKCSFSFLATSWAILQTFVFISFTRLFFRSGSNLNPAEANSIAWNTAKNMIDRIGSSWNISQTEDIIYEYRHLFLLIAAGMIIHWLPERLKRRYRLLFAKMPLAIMAAFVIATIFIMYQFVTADLQAFIYFQF